MTNEEKEIIIDVLCGLALADHLGDVRGEELNLWKLLGLNPEEVMNKRDEYYDETKSIFQVTKKILEENEMQLPDYLATDD